MLKSAFRFIDKFVEFNGWLGGLAILVMMLHVTAYVFFRYTMGIEIYGTIGLVSYYYMLIASFTSISDAERLDLHIKVDVFYTIFPKFWQQVSDYLSAIIVILVYGLLAWTTYELAMGKYYSNAKTIQNAQTLLTWPGYFVLPSAFGLMAVFSLRKLIAKILDCKHQNYDEGAK